MARINWRPWVAAAFVIAALGCSKDAPEPAPQRSVETERPPAEASRPKAVAAGAVLVGVVHEDGLHVCGANYKESWINKFRQVGFVRAVATPELDAELKAQMGKPVVARGRVTDRIPEGTEQPPAEIGECPQYQMRSDWVVTAGGMRIQRSPSPALPAFEVARVEPFDGLRAEIDGTELKVELTNTLGVALANPVEVIVHYEGCYGKPGTEYRRLFGKQGLAPGEKLSGAVPLITEADRVPGNPRATRGHSAYSIEVRAKGADVYFDLDVSVHALGADVKCPQD